ncbi:MAG: TerC family protein [Actinobacteria bacterium]|nr:TerC family protein [Actinomycetota bacterium]
MPLGPFTNPIVSTTASTDFAQFDVALWQWLVLVAVIATLVVADLVVLHRKPHAVTVREAAIETAVWVAIGLGFAGVMLWWHGGRAATEYVSGYVIEQSLSIDNVFVWALIFTHFAVPREYQFRTLFWGVFGALVFRAAFIFAGAALIRDFAWMLVVFGLLLIGSAWKVAFGASAGVDPGRNVVIRAISRFVPTTPDYDGQRLFTRVDAKWFATPLFAVLVMVETTDIVFAVDSVPAILAVSREPFIVFSSNAFAILGLRSVYFLLGGMQDRFRYLDSGLGAILLFVGSKMLVGYFTGWHPATWFSLVVILGLLAGAVVASLVADRLDRPVTGPDSG